MQCSVQCYASSMIRFHIPDCILVDRKATLSHLREAAAQWNQLDEEQVSELKQQIKVGSHGNRVGSHGDEQTSHSVSMVMVGSHGDIVTNFLESFIVRCVDDITKSCETVFCICFF